MSNDFQVDIRSFSSFYKLKILFLSYIPEKYYSIEYKDLCWPWVNSKSGKVNSRIGYRQINWEGKAYKVHRVSYLIFNGFIPQGKIVRHTCNNPLCINPKHLILGSKYDISLDMVKSHRQGCQKLNEEAVKVIKWFLKYHYEIGLINKLAQLYKVKRETISAIRNNKNWQWVKI